MYKKLILGLSFLLMIFFALNAKAQTVYVMGAATGTNGATANALNGTTVTVDCGVSNNFRDPAGGAGGATSYAINQTFTVTFCSNSGLPLYFDFRATGALNIDSGTGDTLFFFDASTNALIATLTQSDDYAFSTPSVGTTSTCVRVVWRSNGAGVDGGWDAVVSCTAPPSCSSNPPAADVFLQAPTICNLNGYCGRTDSYYGEDAPFNLGGTGGNCPTPTDGLFAGTLENNSWLAFEASAATAVFNFNISGGGTCNGLQAAIFAFNTATNSFTRMSPCNLTDGTGMPIGNSTLTGTGLTVGQTYYLMMDGNAGSVCDYTIRANSGVQVANAGADQAVCGTATLAASGTGTWSIISGTGTFANPNNPTTTVTGLAANNVFLWTTSTTLCGTVSDNVAITNSGINAVSSGLQTACVPASNTYSQQITLTYTSPPASGTLLVNGQSFPITASPQTITLANLTANGASVSVTAFFSAIPACVSTFNNVFTAPVSCVAVSPCTPNNGSWD